MHGGKIFLRCSIPPHDLPAQVCWRHAEAEDLESIREYVQEFADAFGYDTDELMSPALYRSDSQQRKSL